MKLRKVISDEQLLAAGVYKLDPTLGILSVQVELLLNRSKTRLEDDRRDEKPPPPYKDGSKVLYRLGDVLEERARLQGKTLVQSAKETEDFIRGFPTFSSFVALGSVDDTWPIATVKDNPVDFFSTLSMQLDELGEIEDMTLEDYLVARLNQARYEASDQVARELHGDGGHPSKPSGGGRF